MSQLYFKHVVIIVQLDTHQFSNILFVRLNHISLVIKIKITWSNFRWTNSYSGIVFFFYICLDHYVLWSNGEKNMHRQQVLHQRCLYLFLMYTLCILTYFQNSTYLATEVKRQTQILRKSYWLPDFYPLYQRSSLFLAKFLRKVSLS